MFAGIDVGHTNVKAVAFDADWTVAATSLVEGGMVQPTDNRREIPIEQRWRIVFECLDSLEEQLPAAASFDGIGLAGGGGGLYPLDADRQPATNGVPLLDERTRDGLFDQWSVDGTRQRVSERTGVPLPPGAVLVMLRWFKENEPETYDAIEHVLNLKDVVRYKLTGELANEASDATFSLTNHRTQEYDRELFELAGIEDAWDTLPELLSNSYDIAGSTTPEVERKTGIPAGTPVVAGAHDACANMIGTGAAGGSTAMTAGGTWSLSTMALEEPVVELDRWCCENFLEKGTWMAELSMPTGTVSLDWFVEEFCQPELGTAERTDRVVWDVIEPKIADAETTALFHPFLFGNPWGYVYQDTASGSFTGLRPSDGRIEMLRAVYEGIAFMHRWQIDVLDEAFGVEEIRFTGGAARSEFWASMFADVLGEPVVTTTVEESGCLGAAMLAAIGVGEITDLEETQTHVDVDEVYTPQGTAYDDKFERFREITEHLGPTWDAHYSLRSP